MPKFNEFIKGFEEKETATKPQEPQVEPAPKTGEPQVQTAPKGEAPKDKYVIFKENEQLKGTPRSNYNAKVRDVNKIQDFGGFSNHEQVRDYLMKYGKGKTADDFEFEGYKQAQPTPQKQEGNVAQQNNVAQPKNEFKPTEPVEKYNDRYNAMTHSEREFNLEASNDKGMYDYVTKNLASLKELAETNPEGVIREITKHGNYPASYYGIEPNNVRKEYVKAVLDGFAEDQESEFNPTEPIEEYNDNYGAKTKSEMEFNLETSNDRGMYEYVKKNLPALQKLAQTNPEGVIRAITTHGNYPRSFYGIEPKNVRKEYVQAVLNGFLED